MTDASLRPSDYDLPNAPKSAMESWMSRLQAIAIVTVLFAGLESQLLSSLPEGSDNQSAVDVILRVCGYSGLILNCGATLSAVLLIVAMGSLPAAARGLYVSCSHGYPRKMFDKEEGDVQKLNELFSHEPNLLRAFGIAKGWDFLLRHCIFCFIAGLAAIIMPSVFVGFVPPFVVFFVGMGSTKCAHCAEDRKYLEV